LHVGVATARPALNEPAGGRPVGALICPRHGRAGISSHSLPIQKFAYYRSHLSLNAGDQLLSLSSGTRAIVPYYYYYRSPAALYVAPRSSQHIHQRRNQQDKCAPVFERNCLCRVIRCPFSGLSSSLPYKMTRRQRSILSVAHCSVLCSVMYDSSVCLSVCVCVLRHIRLYLNK